MSILPKGTTLLSPLTKKLLSPGKRLLNIVITLAGITSVVLYSVCAEACRILQGYILGIDLTYIGFLYAGGLVFLCLLRLDLPFLFLLSVGLGAEAFLVAYQVLHGQYCYFCISFAAGVTLLFIINFGAARKAFGKAFLGTITFAGLAMLLILFEGGAGNSGDEKSVFLPSFGKGRLEVRLYTDHYCDQCALLEARIQPLIADLVSGGNVRVTFINTSAESVYSKYYLYAMKDRTGLDLALRIRALLFEAHDKGISSKKGVELFLREKGIAPQEFDVAPTVRLVMRRIEQDHVSSTPSCVIQDGEKKTVHVGGAGIMTALAALK